MKVKTKELLTILDKLKPGLASKEMVEQATYFVFEGEYVRTYNDSILIAHMFQTGFQAAVQAAEFLSLLKRIQDEEFELSLIDGKIIMTGGKWEGEMVVDEKINTMPVLAGLTDDLWQNLPEDFVDAIRTCSFSVSKLLTFPALSCILVTGQYAYSSDGGLRATRYRMKSEVIEPMVLYGPAAEELIKHNPAQAAKTEGWIVFAGEEELIFGIRARADENEWPEKLIDIYDIKGVTILLPDGLDKVIGRCQAILSMALDRDRLVELFVKDGILICRSQGALGRFTEKVGKVSDNFPQFLVNPDFLMQIFSRIKSVIIGDHLLFKGDNFDHAISLK